MLISDDADIRYTLFDEHLRKTITVNPFFTMYQSLSTHTVPTNPYQEWSIHLYNVPILVTQLIARTNTVQPTLYHVPVLVKL